jgi:hypothetical protein
MRRALVLAVLLCGCGGAASELPAATPTIDMSQFGPSKAVPRTAPPAVKLPALHGSLPAGALGVVDVSGRVGVRPKVLETSEDASVSQLVWSSWAASGASARGEFRVLDCQPTCASGHTRRVAATVELSDVTMCDGRRYFGRASVTLAEGAAPTSYVRAPC